jgi:hypothetical protein
VDRHLAVTGEATVRRVLAHIDADALDRAIGPCLASQQPTATTPPAQATGRHRRQDLPR